MINSINIANFKGLSKLRIEDVSYVNLIGGMNNVGKTSLLEALFLFYNRYNVNCIISLYAFRAITALANNVDSLWSPIFSNFDLNNLIEISLAENGKSNTLFLRINKNYKIPVQQKISPNIITTSRGSRAVYSLDFTYKSFGEKEKIWHHVIDRNNIASYTEGNIEFEQARNAYFMLSSVKTNFQEDAIKFGKLDVLGKIGRLTGFIRDSIEPRLIGLSTITLESQSYIHAQLEGIDRKIPIAQMGDGMSRLISILLNISSNENGVLLIDEIETGIHYTVFPKMWNGIVKAAKEYNCQIFATTHSYECLEYAVKGVEKEDQDSFRYIRLDRKNDKIVSHTFNFEELELSIQKKWEVR